MSKIIHLVGTSGSSKSTAQEAIGEWLVSQNYDLVKLSAPGPLRDLAKEYRIRPDKNPWVEASIFSTDELMTYSKEVFPRQNEKNLVFLFDRGPPDAVVYQGILGGVDINAITRMHSAIPFSDLYLCMIVDGAIGEERIKKRNALTGEPISPNETAERINLMAKGYKQISKYFPNVKLVDTSYMSPQEVCDACIKHVKKIL